MRALRRYVGAMRTGTISRSTKETSIDVTVNLDGTGLYTIETDSIIKSKQAKHWQKESHAHTCGTA